MSRGPDIGTLLGCALYRHSRDAGCALEIIESDWVRWASATFNGARHALVWQAAPSAALDDWLAALPEADVLLRGHLLADIVVAGVTRTADSVRIEIAALTVAER